MSAERAYARLLLAYPRSWRDVRGEEVLAVLLDGAEARGASRPSVAEAVDLVAHGLAARAGLVLDQRTRELTATLALASLAALAVLTLFLGEWWPWPQPVRRQDMPFGWPDGTKPGAVGPFSTLGGPLLPLLVVPAVLALAGRTRAARLLLLALLPALLLLPTAAGVLEVDRPARWTLAGLTAFAALGLLGPARHTRLLAVVTAALVLGLGCAVLYEDLDLSSDPRGGFSYGELLASWELAVPWVVAGALLAGVLVRALVPAALVTAGWTGLLALRRDQGGELSFELLFLTLALAATAVAVAGRSWRGEPAGTACSCCGGVHPQGASRA